MMNYRECECEYSDNDIQVASEPKFADALDRLLVKSERDRKLHKERVELAIKAIVGRI